MTWRFSRGTGRGGQGVNTTDSRVELVVDLAALVTSGEVADRVRATLSDSLRIVVSTDRSQLRNREAAVRRLAERLDAAARPRRHRTPTRRTASSVRRRLEAKRLRSQLKASVASPARTRADPPVRARTFESACCGPPPQCALRRALHVTRIGRTLLAFARPATDQSWPMLAQATASGGLLAHRTGSAITRIAQLRELCEPACSHLLSWNVNYFLIAHTSRPIRQGVESGPSDTSGSIVHPGRQHGDC
ncbi:MAG: peptide chain release factor-like protein [Actinomycetota bacterium]